MTMGVFLPLFVDLLGVESSGARLLDRALCLCSLPSSLLLDSFDTALTDLLRLRDFLDSEGWTRPLGSRDSARRPLHR